VPGEGPLGEVLAQQLALSNQLQRELLMLHRAEDERNSHRMILLQMQAGLDKALEEV